MIRGARPTGDPARAGTPADRARPRDRRAVTLGLLACCLARPAAAAPRPIVAWGDSLTVGAEARDPAARYPARLGALFDPPRPVRNAGVGGESSAQIAARMLADPGSRDAVAVIWAGRNGYGDVDRVLADIAAMTERVREGRFLVLSVLNADDPVEYRGGEGYAIILALNDALRARYGDRYLDVRALLVDRGLAEARLPTTAGDAADIAHDVPPRALRADHLHLNAAGQAVVAARVHAALAARGW